MVLERLAKNAIRAFERRWNYDSGYALEILNDGGFAAIRPLDWLGKVSAYRRDIPAAVYYSAKLTASLAAGCGSCAQLTVAMAEAAGLDAGTLRAIIAQRPETLGPDERLGYDLARTTVGRVDGSDVRQQIVRRWGRRGLASLAYGIAAAQAFPTLKYALGYGHACAVLRVGGGDAAVEIGLTA